MGVFQSLLPDFARARARSSKTLAAKRARERRAKRAACQRHVGAELAQLGRVIQLAGSSAADVEIHGRRLLRRRERGCGTMFILAYS